MTRVCDADLRGIIRFLGSAAPGSVDDPIQEPMLAALQQLIGADDASAFELRRADRGVVSYSTTVVKPWAPGSERALIEVGHQNPIGWQRWAPVHGALRLSEVVSRRELERLDYYQEVMKPNGLRDNIKVWLSSSDESVACISLWRGVEFTPREQTILAVLHHHLIRFRALALAGQRAQQAGEMLTAREAEVLTWAVHGMSNRQIADLLYLSMSTVSKHLERAYDKLGVHSRVEALAYITLRGSRH